MGKKPPMHDSFIQSILANKDIAVDYFRAILPDFIKEKLDFSTLEQLPDSYVSDELRQTVSDIVYSCRRKDPPYAGQAGLSADKGRPAYTG